MGSGHIRYAANGLALGGGVVIGHVKQDTLRNVSFNGFSASVNGSTDSDIVAVFAELDAALGSMGGVDFSAHARTGYVRQNQDGYTEGGVSPLRLTVDGITTESLEAKAGITARTSLWAPQGISEETPQGLDLRVDLGGRLLSNLGDRAIPVRFAASSAGVVLQGDTRDGVQGELGVALDYTTPSGATFTLGYRGEIGQTDRHGVHAGLSLAF